jgi:cytochrome c oxidase cbb3-type subunit 3
LLPFLMQAQGPPSAPGPGLNRVRPNGGFVPGQQRPAGDPVQIERGSKLYSVTCRACHGADLRGGDIGGPNLLRSQVALSDRDGELIVPIIQGSLQNSGMPAINMSVEDAKAVAAYVRSVLATIGSQGKPPSVGQAPPSVLVGDAARGKAYFTAKCSGCHSPSADLRAIGAKYSDPKLLQNAWVAGGSRGRGPAPSGSSAARAVMASVSQPSGETVEGRVLRIDDFLVTLELPDGTTRTIRRNGNVPKVELRDPLKAHRDLLSVYSDQDMHDVTAYLVTLK